MGESVPTAHLALRVLWMNGPKEATRRVLLQRRREVDLVYLHNAFSNFCMVFHRYVVLCDAQLRHTQHLSIRLNQLLHKRWKMRGRMAHSGGMQCGWWSLAGGQPWGFLGPATSSQQLDHQCPVLNILPPVSAWQSIVQVHVPAACNASMTFSVVQVVGRYAKARQ